MQKILIDKLTFPVMVECESDEFLVSFTLNNISTFYVVLNNFSTALTHGEMGYHIYHTGEKNQKIYINNMQNIAAKVL